MNTTSFHSSTVYSSAASASSSRYGFWRPAGALSSMPELTLVLALLVLCLSLAVHHGASWRADQRGPVQGRPASCRISGRGLSSDEKMGLLRAHNELRSKVAVGLLPGLKPASNMLELKWDDELAAVAEAHASQCGTSQHEERSERKILRFSTVGQNLGWEASSEPFLNHLNLPHTEAWAKEYKHIWGNLLQSYRSNDSSIGDSGIGKFTQMIWANTRYLGCGVATYTRRDNVGRYPYQRSLTCNYGPGGNVAGMPVYAEGEPCSRCPNGSTCSAIGLCVHYETELHEKGVEEQVEKSEWNWKAALAALAFVLWLCF